jgi:hypothetical protein
MSLLGSSPPGFQLSLSTSLICDPSVTCSESLLGHKPLPQPPCQSHSLHFQSNRAGYESLPKDHSPWHRGKALDWKPACQPLEGNWQTEKTQSLRAANLLGNQFAENLSLTCATGKGYAGNLALSAFKL